VPADGRNPVLVAIDTPDRVRARELVRQLGDAVGGIKLGLEFFNANGPDGVRDVASSTDVLFLDLKYHDIPNTVAGAVRAAVALRPMILNVHASGGAAMMQAARRAAEEEAARLGLRRPLVIAVTVLTSLDESDFGAGRGSGRPPGAARAGVRARRGRVFAARNRCDPAGLRPRICPGGAGNPARGGRNGRSETGHDALRSSGGRRRLDRDRPSHHRRRRPGRRRPRNRRRACRTMKVRAKICGLNDPDAVRAAVEAGAAFVGFVFYPPSPRALSPDRAAELAAIVPASVGKVGLFVDAGDDEIDAVTAQVTLDMLQLHGVETPERAAELRSRTGLRVMKAISVAAASDVERATLYYESADWLMFDAKPPKDMSDALPGGNALAFDWLLLKGWDFPLPWMLAGGLDAGNVKEAVRLSGAHFVDTSSGVESRPGVKDPERIRAFLKAVAAL